MMTILYCDSVVDHKQVEPDYAHEQKTAKILGFKTLLISFEALEMGNITQALRYIKYQPTPEKGLYRGWMLTPEQYALLYNGLLEKNIYLINTPEEYKHCHYLPESYEKIKSHTPETTWIEWNEQTSLDTVLKCADSFGDTSIIVKDYVKSEKHHWESACFIPNASDLEKVTSTVQNFIALRGNAFNKGLVFRKFEQLQFLTHHSKSGMPLTKEFRLFFMYGKVIALFNYWDEGEYTDETPNLDSFIQIAQSIDSQFFTMDLAQKENGDWIIMELGDGQVAGLPDNANTDLFYTEILQNIAQ